MAGWERGEERGDRQRKERERWRGSGDGGGREWRRQQFSMSPERTPVTCCMAEVYRRKYPDIDRHVIWLEVPAGVNSLKREPY
jgi:hypothetical protein